MASPAAAAAAAAAAASSSTFSRFAAQTDERTEVVQGKGIKGKKRAARPTIVQYYRARRVT